jgi:hypothetical protein
MEWIHVAQDRDQWRTLVTAAKGTFVFHNMLGNSSVSERLAGSQEGLGYVELTSYSRTYLINLINPLNRAAP